MHIPFVDLDAMHSDIIDEALLAIERVVRKGNFILGDEVEFFEEEFAKYSGTKYAVAVDNGLSALKLALLAYNIGEGDEVIVPVNTFIATAGAVSFVGATPVFVDCIEGEYNIDTTKIESAITERTRAIIPVHLYGIPADMDEIMDIADRHNLIVIEDASQAHGAYYKSQRVGGIGHISAFSLYPAKNLGAFGDAGIITLNDEHLVNKLKALRNCGQVTKHQHEYAPHNHRLDTIHAAVLRIKLRSLDIWNQKRQQVAQWYSELLNDSGIDLPQVSQDRQSVWHVFVIRAQNRDDLQKYLGEQSISTGIHYPYPLHLVPYYKDLDYEDGDFVVAEAQAKQMLSLPIYPDMTREQVEYVVNTIKAFEASSILAH